MCYCLDLRPDTGAAKFLSKKLLVLLIGAINVIIWVASIFTLIAPPDVVRIQLSQTKAGYIAGAVLFLLSGIGFSVLLILGVLKNNRTFVQVYCIFVMVVIVLLVMSILINIFTQPALFGISGFLSSSLMILLQILTYFITRNYYLSLVRPPPRANQNQNVLKV